MIGINTKLRKPTPQPPRWYWWQNDNCWWCKNKSNCGNCKVLKETVAQQKRKQLKKKLKWEE